MVEKLKSARHIEGLLALLLLTAAVLVASRGKSSSDSLETRMAAVFSQVDGAGEVSVLLLRDQQTLYDDSDNVTGAVIVAQGAGNMRVALELERAAQALLGLATENIEVLTMTGDP